MAGSRFICVNLEDGSEKDLKYLVQVIQDTNRLRKWFVICFDFSFLGGPPFGSEFGGVVTSAVGLGDPLISN